MVAVPLCHDIWFNALSKLLLRRVDFLFFFLNLNVKSLTGRFFCQFLKFEGLVPDSSWPHLWLR